MRCPDPSRGLRACCVGQRVNCGGESDDLRPDLLRDKERAAHDKRVGWVGTWAVREVVHGGPTWG